MNIGELLRQVNKSRTKQADGEAESQIPQDLQTDPSTELAKNITTEGQAGDEQKVMELLSAIEQGGEAAKGASESMVAAKIAEEMAGLDQTIIEKQAEYYGEKMADSFAQRLIDINNPPISEKQAEEMSKAAGEEEYARWFNAGTALFDGYITKAAEFGTDGGAGIIDNGGQATPSAVNQSEVDVFANDLAGYLASEFGGEGDDGKSAGEKSAFKFDSSNVTKAIKGFFASPKATGVLHTGVDGIDRAVMTSGGRGRMATAVANKLRDFGVGAYGKTKGFGVGTYNAAKAHPYRAGAIAAGVGAAGYAGHRYGPDAYGGVMGNKQSSDAGNILNAFKSGVITKKQAAEKLLSLN